MSDDIVQQPLARAVLTTLARTRDGDDPIGSLAHVILTGQADLRTTASHSWHGQALDSAWSESLARQRELSADEQTELEQQTQRLRDASEDQLVEATGSRVDDSSETEEAGDK